MLAFSIVSGGPVANGVCVELLAVGLWGSNSDSKLLDCTAISWTPLFRCSGAQSSAVVVSSERPLGTLLPRPDGEMSLSFSDLVSDNGSLFLFSLCLCFFFFFLCFFRSGLLDDDLLFSVSKSFCRSPFSLEESFLPGEPSRLGERDRLR